MSSEDILKKIKEELSTYSKTPVDHFSVALSQLSKEQKEIYNQNREAYCNKLVKEEKLELHFDKKDGNKYANKRNKANIADSLI